MQLNLKVIQLMSSRLCHDLVGPAGAIQNGIELFKEMDSDEEMGALKIVADSGEQLLARLAFFRLTFGKGGLNGNQSPLVEARDVTQAFLNGSRISLDWPSEFLTPFEKVIIISEIKLLLNMILVAIDGLPRGGNIAVSVLHEGDINKVSTISLVVRASGPGASFKEDLQFALSSESSSQVVSNLSAHNVHAFFSQRLAEKQSTTIEFFAKPDEVKLMALLSQRPH